MNPFDRGDFGIVFFGSSIPNQTYFDINGKEQPGAFLDDGVKAYMSTAIDNAYFHVGAVARYTFQVDLAGDLGAATLDLGLEGHFDSNPSAPFGKLATFRNDDPPAPATRAVHTFSVSPDRVFLQTANLGAVVEGAIAATLNGVPPGTFAVTVRLRIER